MSGVTRSQLCNGEQPAGPRHGDHEGAGGFCRQAGYHQSHDPHAVEPLMGCQRIDFVETD